MNGLRAGGASTVLDSRSHSSQDRVKFQDMVSILFRDILSSFRQQQPSRGGRESGKRGAFSKAAQPPSFPPSVAAIHRATILERPAAGSSSRTSVWQ